MATEASPAEDRASDRTPSALALGSWLAVALVATKAVYWGIPDATWIGVRDYAEDLPVSVHADLLFATGYGLLAGLVLRLTRAHPRARRAAGLGLLGFGALLCLYAVASIQIFSFLRSPLTYPLLYLAGDLGNMRSSIGSFLTLPIAIALLLAPLAYAAAVRATSAWFRRRRWPVLGQAVAGVALAGFAFWARASVAGPWGDHADHLIARNPHWEFLASVVVDGLGTPGPKLTDVVSPAYLADFGPAPATAPPFAPALRPRNVLVVVLESTGAKYLGLYGSPYATTTNLEREAPHARVFDRFYAHVGLTANSLAAMALSIYPYMTWREYTLEYPELPGETLAEQLGPKGYRTAFLTSGHLDYVGQRRFLQNRGYDDLEDAGDFDRDPAHNSWGTTDGALVDYTLEWIDRDHARPFYAVVWTQQSHHPYDPVPGHEVLDFFKGQLPPDDWDLGRYLNTIHDADRQLGRLFDGLRARGLADDTLVVITGDHGEAFGHPHRTWGHGFRVYEESVRVPMMIWNPRLFPRGERSPVVGGHVDVNPTVAHLLGLPASPTWQGRSLFDGTRPPRTYFYAANDDYLLGAREGDWKYVLNATRGRDELYHLPDDPEEQRNVAALHPERCRELRGRVAAWRHHAAEQLALAREPRAPRPPGPGVRLGALASP